jgi:hypothetical protein
VELVNRRRRNGITVSLYDEGYFDGQRRYLRARVHDRGRLVFDEPRYSPAPSIPWDSDRAVGELLAFLYDLYWAEDLEDDHFTPEQHIWSQDHTDMLRDWADDLGAWD